MLDLNEENLLPYFQPIFSAHSFAVHGYEVLGRIVQDGKVESLGPFFEDPARSEEEKLAVDIIIRRKALELYAAAGRTEQLFINIHPAWIYQYTGSTMEFPSLRMMREAGIDPRKVVIEVTENVLEGDMDAFSEILHQYRRAGCKLAIDDFGSEASNFERMAQVRPDIVKIDRSLVQAMERDSMYKDICAATVQFAESLGTEVLFEGIETKRQLMSSIEAKGSYYQGFLFSKANAGFETAPANMGLVTEGISECRNTENGKVHCCAALIELLDQTVSRYLTVQSANLSVLLAALPPYCRKLYVCDREGHQVSDNYEREPGGGRIAQTVPQFNLFFRSYFNESLYLLSKGRRCWLSRPYRDLSSKEDTVTFCYYLDETNLLFVDVAYKDALNAQSFSVAGENIFSTPSPSFVTE